MKLKEKVFSKYTLYVFCFVILNFFDVVRDMQFVSFQIGQGYIRLEDVLPGYKMGDIWMIISNATGVFMMLIVFSGYRFKNFLSKVNAMWTMLCIAAMIVLPYVRTGQYGTILVQEELAIVNTWWIVLVAKEIIVKTIREKKKLITINLSVCLWIAITFCMFFSIARNHIWPVFYMGMFGCFYLTDYKKEDVIKLFNALIDGSIIAFLLMQTVACLFRPYDTVRYEMMYSDCNMAASYYLIIYTMLLVKSHLLFMQKAKLWKKIIAVVGQGSTLVLMFMTGCRMVWATAVMITVLYGIVVVRLLWNRKWMSLCIRGVVLVGITVMLLVPIHWVIRWTSTVVPARLWYSHEISDEQIHHEVCVGESKYSEKYIELDELVFPLLDRFFKTFTLNETIVALEKQNENRAVVASQHRVGELVAEQVVSSVFYDYSLRERLSIYRVYYEQLNWRGNRLTEQTSSEMSYHAHSLYLQMAYLYGIPAGILLMLMGIVLVLNHLKKILKFKENPYLIMPFFICIIFFFSGLMNVVWNTGQLMLFMLFFTQFPLERVEKI